MNYFSKAIIFIVAAATTTSADWNGNMPITYTRDKGIDFVDRHVIPPMTTASTSEGSFLEEDYHDGFPKDGLASSRADEFGGIDLVDIQNRRPSNSRNRNSRNRNRRNNRRRTPSRRPTPRPPTSSGGDTCADGTRAGRRQFNRLWSGNCDDIFELGSNARRMRDRNFPRNGGNFRQRAFNNCARQEVDRLIQDTKKQCLEKDSRICEDLASAAAQTIVFRDVDGCSAPSRTNRKSSSSDPNFIQQCIRVATNDCRGQISTTIRRFCPRVNVRTSELGRLQGRCGREVRNLVGPRQEFEFDERFDEVGYDESYAAAEDMFPTY